ncbi:LysR family transcriptional regulator [Brevibacillus daliensis]|uniref:LysR family transcriptional regulator n=1 Tax=Brevibacillus daliensis TaxID=2892995 RepID=UPI001E476716|nr:LysR family transcriptional regulator [Brevibacillus daliensis]
MDIREIKYFVQVAKHKNFTLAAKKLHISQPALSKAIKNLENELEVQLFDRADKEIKLTELGDNLLVASEELIHKYEELKGSLYDKSKLNKGNVIIGLPPVIGTSIFVNILTSFREKFPDISLEIIENGAKMVEHNLQNGIIDVGIVIAPVDRAKYDYIPIMEDEVVLLVNKINPLFNKSSVSFADLKKETFLILDKTFMLHHHIIDGCLNHGYKPNIYFESSQWDFLVELVAQNHGITILPKPILKFVDTPSLKIIPFHDPPLKWEVGFLLNRDKYITHVTKTFINHTLEIIGN